MSEQTLDIKDLGLLNAVNDEDRVIMSRSSDGQAAALSIGDLKEKVIKPVVDELETGVPPEAIPTKLGELENVDDSFDAMEDGRYAFEMRDGILHPVPAKDLISGGDVMRLNYIGNYVFTVGLGNEAVVGFKFISTSSDEPTGPGKCTITVGKDVFYSGSIPQGDNFFDVGKALKLGANEVVITVEDIYGAKLSRIYTVSAITLSLTAPNFRWWTAFSDSITIPFIIGGSINKRLVVTVTGVDNDYSAGYEVNLGTATYTETAYNYGVVHPGREGVFRISSYVCNPDRTIRTTPLSFDVICLTSLHSRLMCVNNRSVKGSNWSENALFDYALYDGAATTTSAIFTVYKDGNAVYESEENAIPTATRHTFSFPLEIETDDNSDFSIEVKVTDGVKPLTDTQEFPIRGSYGYSAVGGAALVVNPKTRTNAQGNRHQIINEVNGETIPVTWSGMNWGNDGWQTDGGTDAGTRVLRIMAGASASIDYKPFATEAARTGKTIEIDFKADNVVDGTASIVSMLTPDGNSYTGYRIAPEEITLFSQSKKDGTTQHLPIDTGVRIHTTMTIMPEAYGNSGFNLCCIYINGRKNRVFSYESNDYFAHQGNIVLGSEAADIDIYGIRIYDNALTSEGVQRNYINSLPDNVWKEQEKDANDVLDVNGLNIDFVNTVDQYNCFVFDKPFPRKSNPSSRNGNLEIFFAGKPEMNCTVTNVACDGQGTSSKLYYEWNVRFRVDKTDSVTTYTDGSTDEKNIRLFNNVPKMQRITAKKNWASSMQDHKAGSVNAFNDLAKELELINPAVETDPKARVAVYQEPFIGFYKELNDDGEWVYTCMGEFTMGPDKGDKACFGYDTKAYPDLIAIEGSDNAPLPALFRVPWREDLIAYNEDEEAFQYNGSNSWNLNAGPVGNISSWVPAYNLVYQCSNRILPYNGTLAELNADVINHRSTGYEYWIGAPEDADLYNLYYYEAAQGRFLSSDVGAGIINLYQQLVDKGYGLTGDELAGKTHDEINELFIQARIEKFRKEIPAYFDMDNAVFHHNFIEFIAGTDNRAKNTYTYNFGTEGEKWKWRQDDLDTIFPIDNQGQDKKPYYCETHDLYGNGAPVWNGETSNFWNLLELAFEDELTAGMKRMLAAMERLGGLSSGTNYDKLYAFYTKYYLSVKNYFPATFVNSDARRYENAKLAYLTGTYSNDTDPMTQSHGDFYSAETAWLKKRILYMMSKYSYGTFSADGTDTITIRAAGDEIIYDLVPAMALYPAIANGTSINRGKRTMPGETCRMLINLGGASDQQNNIQGASNLLSIGQWHQKNVSGSMIIQGKRLQEITLGHKTEPVIISITGLTVSNCPAVHTIRLSNISTLSGVLDVSGCGHLKEIYADGTRLAQLKLPEGGGLEVVEYSAYNAYLMLRNFPVLKAENVRTDLCKESITDFLVQDCPNLNAIDLLMDVMNAQNAQGSEHKLKRIRAIGFDATYTESGSQVLDNLAKLADGSYQGLSGDGLAGEYAYPVLEGKLTIHANVYEDSVTTLKNVFPNLDLVIHGDRFVRFVDPEVHRIVVNAIGNGVGVMQSQLDEITQLADIALFSENTLITDFSDFGKTFRNVSKIQYAIFRGCINLKKFGLENPVIFCSNNFGAFDNTGIDEHGIDLTKIRPHETLSYGSLFRDCKFVNVTIPASINYDRSEGIPSFASNPFLRSVILEEGITYVGNCLLKNPSLVKVDFPSTIETIGKGGDGIFGHSSMPSLLYYIIRATTPPIYNKGISGYNIPDDFRIYVPDANIATYKAAPGWSDKANLIVGLSTLPNV